MSTPSRVRFAVMSLVVGFIAVSPPAIVVAIGPAFTERAEFGARVSVTVSWGDFDNDGDLDVAVGNAVGLGDSGSQLYVNNGNGTFTGRSEFGRFETRALAWGDYDNDGDLDMAVANGTSQQNQLYINNGNGTFTAQAQFGTGLANVLAWADFDLDGDIDLAVGRGLLGNNLQNRLYVNNGNGTFTERDEFGDLETPALVWGDFDNDGDPDLAVGNGGAGPAQQNYLYVNNGNGTFTELAEFGTGETFSMAWGDFDNDADLDLAVANLQNSESLLYVNNGGTFMGQLQFGTGDDKSVSFAWGDYDNDGDLDLAAGNSGPPPPQPGGAQNFLYVNNDNGTFTEVAEFGLGGTHGVSWGDFDGDGDLDLAVANTYDPTQNYLYINNLSGGDWLSLHLIGHFHDHGSGHSNRDAIGAKVSVYAQGHLGEPAFLLGYREVEAHGGFASQNQIDPHFGLTGQTAVDLRIVWPGSNGCRVTQVFLNVAVGQRLVIDEASPNGDFCDPPPEVLADPSGTDKTRFLSFSVPQLNVAVVVESALRVRLVSLHHVMPPYTGGPSVPFTSFEGQVRWVGPPTQYIESNASPTPFYAATLQCTPHYQDWSTVGLLHVTGSAITPSSMYEVENLAASCAGIESACSAVSAPLSIETTRWADVEQPYNPPSATIQPDLGDVGALVNKFRSAPGAPIKARALLAGDDAFGNITTLGIDLGFGHIAACVDAFRGKPYPFTIAACP